MSPRRLVIAGDEDTGEEYLAAENMGYTEEQAATGFDVNQPIPDEELEPFDPDGIIDDLEGCEDD